MAAASTFKSLKISGMTGIEIRVMRFRVIWKGKVLMRIYGPFLANREGWVVESDERDMDLHRGSLIGGGRSYTSILKGKSEEIEWLIKVREIFVSDLLVSGIVIVPIVCGDFAGIVARDSYQLDKGTLGFEFLQELQTADLTRYGYSVDLIWDLFMEIMQDSVVIVYITTVACVFSSYLSLITLTFLQAFEQFTFLHMEAICKVKESGFFVNRSDRNTDWNKADPLFEGSQFRLCLDTWIRKEIEVCDLFDLVVSKASQWVSAGGSRWGERIDCMVQWMKVLYGFDISHGREFTEGKRLSKSGGSVEILCLIGVGFIKSLVMVWHLSWKQVWVDSLQDFGKVFHLQKWLWKEDLSDQSWVLNDGGCVFIVNTLLILCGCEKTQTLKFQNRQQQSFKGVRSVGEMVTEGEIDQPLLEAERDDDQLTEPTGAVPVDRTTMVIEEAPEQTIKTGSRQQVQGKTVVTLSGPSTLFINDVELGIENMCLGNKNRKLAKMGKSPSKILGMNAKKRNLLCLVSPRKIQGKIWLTSRAAKGSNSGTFGLKGAAPTKSSKTGMMALPKPSASPW